MLITVTGGSGSGKSEFAEKTAMELARKDKTRLIYLATMQPLGREAEARIRRHRELRRGKGFVTIERSKDLCGIPERDREQIRGATVLLEDLSNLTAGQLFSGPDEEGNLSDGHQKEAFRKILEGLHFLREQAGNLVIVANEVYSDGQTYDRGTECFLSLTGRVSCLAAAAADRSYEVVCGIPISLKGEPAGKRKTDAGPEDIRERLFSGKTEDSL